MTEENRVYSAQAERELAEEFLTATKGMINLRLWNRAIAQIYFVLLHACRALLFTEGIEARSHKGASGLLSLHFVKTGLLDGSVTQILSSMQQERENADYLSAYHADEVFFREKERVVMEALQRVDALLVARGVSI